MVESAVDEKSVKKSIKSTIQLAAIIAILVVFSLAIIKNLQYSISIKNEIDITNELILKEELIKEELQIDFERSDSPEVAEKIARERLGLVKEDDIIFIPEYE